MLFTCHDCKQIQKLSDGLASSDKKMQPSMVILNMIFSKVSLMHLVLSPPANRTRMDKSDWYN